VLLSSTQYDRTCVPPVINRIGDNSQQKKSPEAHGKEAIPHWAWRARVEEVPRWWSFPRFTFSAVCPFQRVLPTVIRTGCQLAQGRQPEPLGTRGDPVPGPVPPLPPTPSFFFFSLGPCPPAPPGPFFPTHPPSISIKPSHPHAPTPGQSHSLLSLSHFVHLSCSNTSTSLATQTITSGLFILTTFYASATHRHRFRHRH
jgi:hypothetical protein